MQNKKIFVPPIKSQGIKTKLVPWITSVVDQLGLDKKFSVWIEPFFGTGVVVFNQVVEINYMWVGISNYSIFKA